jgi:ribulose-5-phosphate 4-epimerase/fuculose-1-phosphate aldolase
MARESYPALVLNPAQEVALLARVLSNEGYDDHLSGLVTYKQPDGTFLVNPYLLKWDELRASDIARMDADGSQLSGPWVISEALSLLRAIHEVRPDVKIAIHGHGRYATLWAAMKRPPRIYDQTGAGSASQLVVIDEYTGPHSMTTGVQRTAQALGDANFGLLANHGVVVLARDIPEAYYRAMSLEWRSRFAWQVEALGGADPIDPEVAASVVSNLESDQLAEFRGGLFAAMARAVVRSNPAVLE